MSRNIKTTVSSLKESDKQLRNTQHGKVLFTRYRDRMCALYLSANRLLAARVMSDTPNRIGAIYIGKIKNMAKNIDACFLEIGDREICFLPLRDAASPILLNREYDGRLLEGDELLVQISKDAHKTKQASVTANLSLSDEYIVLSIGSPRIGYSGKLDKQRREEIKNWLIDAGLQQKNGYDLIQDRVPVTLGLVVRTRAGDCTEETLLWHIQNLLDAFSSMVETARHKTCFSCIMQAPEDYEAVLDELVYPYEYEEILTDDAGLYEKLSLYCKDKLPDKQLRFYEDDILSLSKLYSLEQKLDTALNKRVWLKSGGYLVIEPTEALTVIDVNTGKYEGKKGSSDKMSQETYEKINREAAEEIALQLRLRNMSGMILVDFINMASKEKEKELLEFLRNAVRKDKMKTLVVDITPLGLVEITRKKQNKPLWEQFPKERISHWNF